MLPAQNAIRANSEIPHCPRAASTDAVVPEIFVLPVKLVAAVARLGAQRGESATVQRSTRPPHRPPRDSTNGCQPARPATTRPARCCSPRSRSGVSRASLAYTTRPTRVAAAIPHSRRPGGAIVDALAPTGGRCHPRLCATCDVRPAQRRTDPRGPASFAACCAAATAVRAGAMT